MFINLGYFFVLAFHISEMLIFGLIIYVAVCIIVNAQNTLKIPIYSHSRARAQHGRCYLAVNIRAEGDMKELLPMQKL